MIAHISNLNSNETLQRKIGKQHHEFEPISYRSYCNIGMSELGTIRKVFEAKD